MYHTETTSEGRLLHDWFTSKHRLISVVSSAPSQAVSPESSVSEELPCVISPPPRQWRHAHMQAGLWHYDEKDSQRQNRKTVNAQPASIIMNSASQPQASSRRQGHHSEHIQSIGHHAGNASNPKPCRQPCGFPLVILFPNPSFSCVNMRPFLWSVAAETRYEAEITETAKHTASESKPCQHTLIL